MIGSVSDEGGTNAFPVRAEINVTSLVDVAFTLLIIFMITAPILQGGVEIDVPRAPAAPLENAPGVVVSVDRDGTVYIDETRVSLEEFETAGMEIVRRKQPAPVYVKGDANVPYGTVLKVIGLLNEAGVEAVSLVAQPEMRRGR